MKMRELEEFKQIYEKNPSKLKKQLGKEGGLGVWRRIPQIPPWVGQSIHRWWHCERLKQATSKSYKIRQCRHQKPCKSKYLFKISTKSPANLNNFWKLVGVPPCQSVIMREECHHLWWDKTISNKSHLCFINISNSFSIHTKKTHVHDAILTKVHDGMSNLRYRWTRKAYNNVIHMSVYEYVHVYVSILSTETFNWERRKQLVDTTTWNAFSCNYSKTL